MSQLEILLESWRHEVEKAQAIAEMKGEDTIGKTFDIEGIGKVYCIPGGAPPDKPSLLR